ncbi:MAG: RDD family protein [Acidimicrobiales bacterium]|jgi:uncharacterized RDD family membrane protein YckC
MSTVQRSGIVTPEAVVLEFDTASVGSRTIAEIIDVLVQLACLVAVWTVTAFIVGTVGSLETVAVIVGLVLTLLVLVGYPAGFETLWRGRTLGKAAMGLRVVTREGGTIRFRHAAIRAMFALIEIYASFGAIAVISIILTRDDQRVGDLAAGTIVLRERTAGSRAVAVSFLPPPGFEAYTASLDVTALTQEQYGLIRSFLLRAHELTPPARSSLAARLATPVAQLLRHAPPPQVGPELFLACVAAAYQRRHGGPLPPPPVPWPPSPS